MLFGGYRRSLLRRVVELLGGLLLLWLWLRLNLCLGLQLWLGLHLLLLRQRLL